MLENNYTHIALSVFSVLVFTAHKAFFLLRAALVAVDDTNLPSKVPLRNKLRNKHH